MPWSTWPMTTTTGARGTRSSGLSSAVSMSFSSMVTMTSCSTLQPISSAMMAAVSKSMTSDREAMTPFLIRVLTTSAPVFFIREASSPTEISSGMSTFTGAFLAISSWSRRIRSCSSWRRLLPEPAACRRWRWALRPWNFCLPPRCCCRSVGEGLQPLVVLVQVDRRAAPGVHHLLLGHPAGRLAACWAGRAPPGAPAGGAGGCLGPPSAALLPLGGRRSFSWAGAGLRLGGGPWARGTHRHRPTRWSRSGCAGSGTQRRWTAPRRSGAACGSWGGGRTGSGSP